jgi:hypothetical protein
MTRELQAIGSPTLRCTSRLQFFIITQSRTLSDGTKPTNVVTLDISDVTKANIQSIHNKGQIAVCTFSAGTVTQKDDDMCVWHASAPNGLS